MRGEAGPSTRAVHAGLHRAERGAPLLPPPALAAVVRWEGDAAPEAYGRDRNPSWSALEAALGELDGGEAVVFASGMAALSAVLVPRLRAGDVLVAGGDGYPGVRRVAAERL